MQHQMLHLKVQDLKYQSTSFVITHLATKYSQNGGGRDNVSQNLQTGSLNGHVYVILHAVHRGENCLTCPDARAYCRFQTQPEYIWTDGLVRSDADLAIWPDH